MTNATRPLHRPPTGAPSARHRCRSRAGLSRRLPAGLAFAGLAFTGLAFTGLGFIGQGRAQTVEGAVTVLVARVARRDVPITLTGLGTVEAVRMVTIRARVDGELTRIAFTEGEHVHAGQVLAQIDPRTLQAQLEQARALQARDEAQLQNAQLDLQRVAGLAGRQYTSKQSVDTQKAMVAQLQGTVRQDRAQADYASVELGFATIASPIDGVTGLRLLDQGNLVRATDASGIVTVSQVQPIDVVFTVPEDSLPEIRAGMAQAGSAARLPVSAFDRAGARQLAEGGLLAIDNQVDQATATVRLKAEFANASEALWPGQFVVARLRLGTLHDALVAPASAIRVGPDGKLAFVVGADNRVQLRHVETDAAGTGDVVIIKSGLSPGETVVTEGQYKLEAGMQVAVAAGP